MVVDADAGGCLEHCKMHSWSLPSSDNKSISKSCQLSPEWGKIILVKIFESVSVGFESLP